MTISNYSFPELKYIGILGKDDNVQIFINTDYEKKGSFVKVWWLLNYKNGTKNSLGKVIYSNNTLHHFDCSERKVVLLGLVQYDDLMGKGNIIYNKDVSYSNDWEIIYPNSIMDGIRSEVCN